eukprot:501668-Hanusia_phi.AAC.5
MNRKYYSVEDLGPETFWLNGDLYIRKDFKASDFSASPLVCDWLEQLQNRSQMSIACSHYFPVCQKSGILSCRTAILLLIREQVKQRRAYLVLCTCMATADAVWKPTSLRTSNYGCDVQLDVDFAGCGVSDGNIVTLGYREVGVNWLRVLLKKSFFSAHVWIGRFMRVKCSALRKAHPTLTQARFLTDLQEHGCSDSLASRVR